MLAKEIAKKRLQQMNTMNKEKARDSQKRKKMMLMNEWMRKLDGNEFEIESDCDSRSESMSFELKAKMLGESPC